MREKDFRVSRVLLHVSDKRRKWYAILQIGYQPTLNINSSSENSSLFYISIPLALSYVWYITFLEIPIPHLLYLFFVWK